MWQCAQIIIVSAQARRAFAPRSGNLRAPYSGGDSPHNAIGNTILQSKHVLYISFEPFGPNMRASFAINKLRCDAYPVCCLSYTTFQDISNAKLLPDLPCVDRLSLISEAGIARYNEEPTNARKGGGDLLDHTVSKGLLCWITAHVCEGKHSD